MLQDLLPHVYHNEMSFDAPQAQDLVLIFRDRQVLARMEDGEPRFPTVRELHPEPSALRYLFAIDEARYYLLPGSDCPAAEGFSMIPTAQLRSLETSPGLFAAAAGESLDRWYRSQTFCGRCGARMEPGATERSMVCPRCGNTVYPKICPAVIVAITDHDRIVLTRYKDRPFKKYALVAGFNEIGESIEDTVRREAFEETGLRVKNLRFYKSQPWVFTDTLLMGFYCELDGSDAITVQEDELAEAAWFGRHELPTDHSHISLTGEMIEQFRLGLENGG